MMHTPCLASICKTENLLKTGPEVYLRLWEIPFFWFALQRVWKITFYTMAKNHVLNMFRDKMRWIVRNMKNIQQEMILQTMVCRKSWRKKETELILPGCEAIAGS
jgi:hypothetical protein